MAVASQKGDNDGAGQGRQPRRRRQAQAPARQGRQLSPTPASCILEALTNIRPEEEGGGAERVGARARRQEPLERALRARDGVQPEPEAPRALQRPPAHPRGRRRRPVVRARARSLPGASAADWLRVTCSRTDWRSMLTVYTGASRAGTTSWPRATTRSARRRTSTRTCW